MAITQINAFKQGQQHFACLSDDDKPTTGVNNGDLLDEIDTGKRYQFDAENTTWYESSAEAQAVVG